MPCHCAEEAEGSIPLSDAFGRAGGSDHAGRAIPSFLRDTPERQLWSCPVLPRQGDRVRSTWVTKGMRGSGSKTIMVSHPSRLYHKDVNALVTGLASWPVTHSNPNTGTTLGLLFLATAPTRDFQLRGMICRDIRADGGCKQGPFAWIRMMKML